MKKIACFIPSLEFGGSQIAALNLVNSLVESNIGEVELVICNNKGELVSLLNPNVKVYDLRCDKLSLSLFKLIKYFRKQKPDYLFSHSDIPNIITIISKKISFNISTKIVLVQHNYFNAEMLSIKYIGKYIPYLIKWTYPHAYKIISVSQGLKYFLEDFFKNNQNISCIYNYINESIIEDIANRPISLKYKYFLFVGRLEPIKNLFFLLDVYSKFLKENGTCYRLLIIGDGSLKNELIEYCKYLEIEEMVIFLGSIINPYNYIKNASIVFLTSFSEALPTIIVESLFLGKTIISSPNEGAKELLQDGKLGYLSTSFDNVEEFLQLINKALEVPFESKYIIREIKKNFSKLEVNEKYLQIIK